MSAEYILSKSVTDIARQIGVATDLPEKNLARIKLYAKAPIIRRAEGSMALALARYSLKPQGTPFASFHAPLFSYNKAQGQIVTIQELRQWSDVFQKNRCLVPLSGLIEATYRGEQAGSFLEFYDRQKPLLFAAGVCEEAFDEISGEFYFGFALITHTPAQLFKSFGHFHQPLFLKADSIVAWLRPESDFRTSLKLLLDRRQLPDFTFKKDRKMPHGWEKAVPAMTEKARSEEEIERLIHQKISTLSVAASEP